MSNVLITGATGFIGSNLTKRLLNSGLHVGIIKRPGSDIIRIKDIMPSLKVYETDASDFAGVLSAVKDFNPDFVFHLAAYYTVKHDSYDIPGMFSTNLMSIINLLESLRIAKTKIKLFVNTSSCFVYKESGAALKEDSPLEPFNLYALTKIQSEEVCSFYSKRFNIRSATFRLFPPYGPGDHERRLVPYIIRKLSNSESPQMTLGMQKWDFIYLDDIVDAYVCLIRKYDFPAMHEVFNIGTGDVLSIRDMYSKIKAILKSDIEADWGRIPYRDAERMCICADISKANKLLGWNPKIKAYNRGLELTVKWFENLWRVKV